MKEICCFLSLLIFVQARLTVTEGEKCYGDTCGPDQFCSHIELDKRCVDCTCSPEQGKIIHQCKEICDKKSTTISTPATKAVTTPSKSLGSSESESGTNWSIIVVAICVLVFIVGSIIAFIFCLYTMKMACFAHSPIHDLIQKLVVFFKKEEPPTVNEKKFPIQVEDKGHSSESSRLMNGEDDIATSPTSPTSPTVDVHSDQHKILIDPSAIAIHKPDHTHRSDQTCLKMPVDDEYD